MNRVALNAIAMGILLFLSTTASAQAPASTARREPFAEAVELWRERIGSWFRSEEAAVGESYHSLYRRSMTSHGSRPGTRVFTEPADARVRQVKMVETLRRLQAGD